MKSKTQRICPNGHRYYKSSDCPVCPVCEDQKKPAEGFLSLLSAPARRALLAKGISTIEKLAKHSEQELLQLHGFGPGSLPKLRQALNEKGLAFKED